MWKLVNGAGCARRRHSLLQSVKEFLFAQQVAGARFHGPPTSRDSLDNHRFLVLLIK